MGMFDTVRCAYPLPSHQDEEFHIKDLPDVHGDIRIYTSGRNAEGGSDWTEFILRFTHGVVETVSEA